MKAILILILSTSFAFGQSLTDLSKGQCKTARVTYSSLERQDNALYQEKVISSVQSLNDKIASKYPNADSIGYYPYKYNGAKVYVYDGIIFSIQKSGTTRTIRVCPLIKYEIKEL